MTPRLPWDAWALAAILAVAAGGLWAWDHALMRRAAAGAAEASASDVRERFPMPAPFHPPEEEASVLLRAAASARPFSSQRGQPPPPPASLPGGLTAYIPAPTTPVFIYKGVVVMGAIHRAILEEAASKKTYFLQVGQEVAGFKVLDIDESRVILSHPNTQEEIAVSRSPTMSP